MGLCQIIFRWKWVRIIYLISFNHNKQKLIAFLKIICSNPEICNVISLHLGLYYCSPFSLSATFLIMKCRVILHLTRMSSFLDGKGWRMVKLSMHYSNIFILFKYCSNKKKIFCKKATSRLLYKFFWSRKKPKSLYSYI